MNILIIEDEQASATKLIGYLSELRPEWSILGTLSGVRESIQYFDSHPEPDLVFLDVQLSDGESLRIFDEVSIDSYVIFLTAFSEFALQAFHLNTVDYLLKPFTKRDTQKSLNKLDAFINNRHATNKRYQERFLVKKGASHITLRAEDIAYCVKDDLLFLFTTTGDKYLYDASLERLEAQLDPERFFRINRQMMVSYDAIQRLVPASSNRCELILEPGYSSRVVVSQGRVGALKAWLSA